MSDPEDDDDVDAEVERDRIAAQEHADQNVAQYKMMHRHIDTLVQDAINAGLEFTPIAGALAHGMGAALQSLITESKMQDDLATKEGDTSMAPGAREQIARQFATDLIEHVTTAVLQGGPIRLPVAPGRVM